jgi:hypothetical protein
VLLFESPQANFVVMSDIPLGCHLSDLTDAAADMEEDDCGASIATPSITGGGNSISKARDPPIDR